MTVNKRKKVTKYRGSVTHGGGSMKKRRGAGHRGGRGMAGSGKRGDVKKSISSKIKGYFGVNGFHRHGQRVENTKINVGDLSLRMDSLVKQGLAEKKDAKYIIDLSKLKINKLLGSGQVTKEIDVTVRFATSSAIEKIESAGGNVNIEEVSENAFEEVESENE